jgi:hypothetical protein
VNGREGVAAGLRWNPNDWAEGGVDAGRWEVWAEGQLVGWSASREACDAEMQWFIGDPPGDSWPPVPDGGAS